MKRHIALLVLVFAFTVTVQNTVAQDTTAITKKEQKKVERENRKQEKKAKQAAEKEKLEELLSHRFFVFRASRLYDTRGRTYAVSPTTNFLYVIDSLVTLQFAFDQLAGWNGAILFQK